MGSYNKARLIGWRGQKGGFTINRPVNTIANYHHFTYTCWDCSAIYECPCHPKSGHKKPYHYRCYLCKVKKGEIDEAIFGLPTWE